MKLFKTQLIPWYTGEPEVEGEYLVSQMDSRDIRFWKIGLPGEYTGWTTRDGSTYGYMSREPPVLWTPYPDPGWRY